MLHYIIFNSQTTKSITDSNRVWFVWRHLKRPLPNSENCFKLVAVTSYSKWSIIAIIPIILLDKKQVPETNWKFAMSCHSFPFYFTYINTAWEMYLYKDIKQLCTLKIWTAYLLTNLSPQKITYKSYQMKNMCLQGFIAGNCST